MNEELIPAMEIILYISFALLVASGALFGASRSWDATLLKGVPMVIGGILSAVCFKLITPPALQFVFLAIFLLLFCLLLVIWLSDKIHPDIEEFIVLSFMAVSLWPIYCAHGKIAVFVCVFILCFIYSFAYWINYRFTIPAKTIGEE